MVKFALRARASNGGKNPRWTSYEKIREVIEKRMFSQVEDLLPVISFGAKKDSETEKKHDDFVERMIGARLHRAPGPPAGRMVHAGARRRGDAQIEDEDDATDHRPPAESQRQEPAQPAALPRGPRRADQAGGARQHRRAARIADVGAEEDRCRFRVDGIGEPHVPPCRHGGDARPRAARQQGVRRGDRIPKPQGGGGGRRPRGPADGDGEDDFEFTLTREEFLDSSSRISELPDLVKAPLKDADADASRAAPAISVAGSPPTSTCSAPCATAWRGASRCAGPNRERSSARSRARRVAEAAGDRRRRPKRGATARRARGVLRQRSAHPLHRPGRRALQPLRARAACPRARR